jgi:hypothetical protein
VPKNPLERRVKAKFDTRTLAASASVAANPVSEFVPESSSPLFESAGSYST